MIAEYRVSLYRLDRQKIDEGESEMVKPSRFWDRTAERYARSAIADEAAYQKKLDVTRSYFRPDMDVLEFGCGTGSTALLHAPYVKHIHAIDFSANMIAIARTKAAAQGVQTVSFEQAAIDDLAVADESYDMVLGLSILHLVADRDAVIARVHRLLRPGGIFVSSTACIADMGILRLLEHVAPAGYALGLLPLVRCFSADDLRRSLTAAGFTIAHDWQPGPKKAVFIVATKSGRGA